MDLQLLIFQYRLIKILPRLVIKGYVSLIIKDITEKRDNEKEEDNQKNDFSHTLLNFLQGGKYARGFRLIFEFLHTDANYGFGIFCNCFGICGK